MISISLTPAGKACSASRSSGSSVDWSTEHCGARVREENSSNGTLWDSVLLEGQIIRRSHVCRPPCQRTGFLAALNLLCRLKGLRRANHSRTSGTPSIRPRSGIMATRRDAVFKRSRPPISANVEQTESRMFCKPRSAIRSRSGRLLAKRLRGLSFVQ